MTFEMFGMLAHGLFVGWLLGLGLTETTPKVRAAIAFVGAILGAVPILVVTDSKIRWIYPIGLLLGVLWSRLPKTKRLPPGLHNPAKSEESQQTGTIFAYFDIAAFILIVIALAVYTLMNR